MSGTKSKSARIFQVVTLLLFTIVLPLGSWFYLKMGFDYNKEAMAELKDYGAIPVVNLSQSEGSVNESFLEGNVLQVYFLPREEKERAALLNLFERMHHQFDERHDVLFLVYDLKSPDHVAIDFADPDQALAVELPAMELEALIREQFRQPRIEKVGGEAKVVAIEEPKGDALSDYPYIVLVDSKGVVRNYYDYRDPYQIKRLIEHTALIMPREKEEKPQLHREKEK